MSLSLLGNYGSDDDEEETSKAKTVPSISIRKEIENEAISKSSLPIPTTTNKKKLLLSQLVDPIYDFKEDASLKKDLIKTDGNKKMKKNGGGSSIFDLLPPPSNSITTAFTGSSSELKKRLPVHHNKEEGGVKKKQKIDDYEYDHGHDFSTKNSTTNYFNEDENEIDEEEVASHYQHKQVPQNQQSYYTPAEYYDPASAYAVGGYEHEYSTGGYDNTAIIESRGTSSMQSNLPEELMREMMRNGGVIDETVTIKSQAVHNAAAWKPTDDTMKKKSTKEGFETQVWDEKTGQLSTTANVSKIAKAKHQLGWLAAQASSQAEEMAEKKGKLRLTKAQTQAKYGW